MSNLSPTPVKPAQTKITFIAFTAVASAVAAVAAGSSAALSLPVWAMFIGWVAFFGRGLTPRDGLVNLGCVVLGIALGMGAALSIRALGPIVGMWALPLVVFGVAMIVVSLRSLRVMNNVLAYFLGLIAFFASQLAPSFESFEQLASASSLGSFSGWVAHTVQSRLFRKAPVAAH